MNNRGVALILFYSVVAVMTIMGSAFFAGTISENQLTQKYANSTRAFWIAEAGLNQAYYNWVNNIAQPVGAVNFSEGTYSIDTSNLPNVTVTGTVNNAQRSVSAFFMGIPLAFQNTISIGGDMALTGLLARAEVYGKTRISGNYTKTFGASDYFEDKQTGVSSTGTTIPIPDYNTNGTPNEFADFVLFGQKAVQDCDPNEVVYVKNNGTVNIFPNQSLIGKKLIYVEGSAPGEGNVNIFFDGNWQDNEDLTIISTGAITYVEPLQVQENARLSTVSWGNYNEASIFRSQHESVIYTHSNSNFVDILDWGSTSGNIIVNGNLSLLEVLTYERYYYSSRAQDGDLPPGFQWLSNNNGTKRLLHWQE
ncbi:MAG: pilus assembly PilX N-terminal domain-containing protein [Candidatus Omnitrophica bacterium]|nr:pilus assembly PilX N-terminal domain-containing protein [Candidatus Omnitrophota bacterium]